MREIKFRVWCNNKYHNEDYNILYNDGSWKIKDWNTNKTLYSSTYKDVGIIEQYTGLKDKNGVEIYEGDRVRLDLNNEGFKEAVVNFRYGCFVFDTPKECYTVWESDVLEQHIEVVGNIHENKELLK